jgi:hypothetical protein
LSALIASIERWSCATAARQSRFRGGVAI